MFVSCRLACLLVSLVCLRGSFRYSPVQFGQMGSWHCLCCILNLDETTPEVLPVSGQATQVVPSVGRLRCVAGSLLLDLTLSPHQEAVRGPCKAH